MRRDLPYALSGLALGVLLLGNAALAPDAAPVGALDVTLVLVMAAALAVCRRHPVVTLLAVAAAMLAFHVRVHPGVSAAFPVLGAVYVAAWRGHRAAPLLASLVFLGGFLARDVTVAPAGRPGQQIAERTALLLGWFVAANVAGSSRGSAGPTWSRSSSGRSRPNAPARRWRCAARGRSACASPGTCTTR
ncbi:hypothetical protein [Micromonospora sp. PLK6-60]|uniref:DUF7134 domain-containing protein n=1 Tax=Micromonospora sp. PLK6-60 TaxID=2873383 RepID=UPI0021059698|nr:hypothetical protein [Micromonospora sp. PLK6-60]